MTLRGDIVRRIRREVPRAPGVYLFCGEDETLLYVGKSVDLRSRMLSYFGAPADEFPRRIQDMVRMVRTFRCITTRTELEALLLEDRLIKEKQPPVNVSQKRSDPCSYLVVTSDTYPALSVAIRPVERREIRSFGPFKDRRQAARLKAAIVDHLGLRSCQGAVPSRGCYRREIGTCPGPCRGDVTTEEYIVRVGRALRFLRGNDGPMVTALEALKKRQVESLALEKAAETRDLVSFCRAFAERQRFLSRFRRGWLRIVEPTDRPDAPLVHVFAKGRWDAIDGCADAHELRHRIRELQDPHCTSTEEDRAVTDRGLIVHRWMRAHEGSFEWTFQGLEGTGNGPAVVMPDGIASRRRRPSSDRTS
ncbi:MAG: GIY-YIG nuclease family protein [Candidatus Riflebacteria bacterium]|nr:GIY-YIG nuclease family protein [Candidatus Riflebacteria bacterium]